MNKSLLGQAYDTLKKAIATIEKIPKLHTRNQTIRKLAQLDQQLASLRDDLELCNEDDVK